jgi:hypothetical protein
MFWRTNTFFGAIRFVGKCDLPNLNPMTIFVTSYTSRVSTKATGKLSKIYVPNKIYTADPKQKGNRLTMLVSTV